MVEGQIHRQFTQFPLTPTLSLGEREPRRARRTNLVYPNNTTSGLPLALSLGRGAG